MAAQEGQVKVGKGTAKPRGDMGRRSLGCLEVAVISAPLMVSAARSNLWGERKEGGNVIGVAVQYYIPTQHTIMQFLEP